MRSRAGGMVMACMLAAGGFLGAEPRPGAEAGRGAGPIRALLLIDEGYGGNWLARDGKPSIAESLLSFGWELELASPAGSAGPCPWGAARGMGRLSTLRIDAIGDVLAYDLVVVLPGSKPGGLAADPAALALLKAADSGGLAIAAFCRGARVLAAAGVLEGRRMTGHPDYAEEYRAAGALYQGFEDLEGKSDAPPPVVDGRLVTSVRSSYYRGQSCEAIRIAAENARAARAARTAAPQGGPAAARSAAFAFMAAPGKEKEALALASSLRRFGGALRDSRILALVPGGPERLSARGREGLAELGAELRGYGLEPAIAAFPLAAKVPAAAAAEAALAAEAPSVRPEVLVWMDSDTVILREPAELLLPAGALLGYRPVHHVLVGSPWGSEPDEYWSAFYAACGTEPAAAFPLTTTIDRRAIRFYPNAGLLAVRPEAGLLRRWAADFGRAYARPELAALYGRDSRKELFAHQAILAASLLAALPRSAMVELSFAYNYPAHLHGSCPAELRPGRLEDLATLRYDSWGNWARLGSAALPARSPALAEWLASMR